MWVCDVGIPTGTELQTEDSWFSRVFGTVPIPLVRGGCLFVYRKL